MTDSYHIAKKLAIETGTLPVNFLRYNQFKRLINFLRKEGYYVKLNDNGNYLLITKLS